VSVGLREATGPVPRRRLLRTWRSALFAPAGDGQRRRRGSDGVRLIAAAAAVACSVLVIRFDSRIDQAIIAVIHPPPRSITWLVTLVYQGGSLGIMAVLAALALLSRRWEIVRDIALSAAGTAALSAILILVLGSRGGRPGDVVIEGYSLSFPVLQVALLSAVATAALPYLARGVQRIVEAGIALSALACAVGGHGLPLNVAGSLAIGWGATATVRLVFGSPLGLPSADDVRRLLEELGIRSAEVRPASTQAWGAARYRATEANPGDDPAGRLGVEVYGRDAADARLLAKVYRFVMYRDSGPALPVTRLQQVEHEAWLTVRAGQAGVAVPEVVEAGAAGPSGDALLVWRRPAGRPLSEAGGSALSERTLDELYRQLLALRRARISHGAISGDCLMVDPAAGAVVVTGFGNAASSASEVQLDRDMAGAIAATAVAVGAERAAGHAARCLDQQTLGAALRHLQKPALDPALNRDLRGKRGLLEDVRQQAARAASIELPPLAEPRRVSWPTLILIIGTLIGGWALIGVLIDVSASFDTVIGADWLWVIIAFVLAQLVFVASGLEAIGSVAGPLPFGRAVAVEVGNSFSALAGGTAAVFATRVRFFQKQGYDSSLALSSGAIMTASSWGANLLLFACSLPFAWDSIHFEAAPESGGNAKLVWVILAVVVAAALVAGLALAVPRLRRRAADRLRPKVSDIWGNLKEIASSPRKLLLLLAGSFALELLVAMALSVSLRAFGDHLRLPVLIVAITLAGVIGAVSPTPGGMGVVEASMILGLTAAGVPEADATAAVFIQRLFTSYLPPIWGWGTLVWLRNREFL
jgi:undecaprenyl-diphosphatase